MLRGTTNWWLPPHFQTKGCRIALVPHSNDAGVLVFDVSRSDRGGPVIEFLRRECTENLHPLFVCDFSFTVQRRRFNSFARLCWEHGVMALPRPDLEYAGSFDSPKS
jgi:hypothetical protein